MYYIYIIIYLKNISLKKKKGEECSSSAFFSKNTTKTAGYYDGAVSVQVVSVDSTPPVVI